METQNKLTAEQLQSILMNVYSKGSNSKEIGALDIVNELKQTILQFRTTKQDK